MRCWLWLFFGGLALASPASAAFRPSAANNKPGDLVESSAPEDSKFLPPIEGLARPSEQRIANDFLVQLIAGSHDSAAILKACDEILPKLTAPTQFRGFVQLTRASALSAL